MNKAIRITAGLLGVTAGIAALEHGYFEFLQGNIVPDGLFIVSIGPPCDPEVAWNACEPALTTLPDMRLTGIVTVLIGFLTIIWSIFFLQRKYGGLVLILLSIGSLLFGGGLFPPVIGILAGLTAAHIDSTLDKSRKTFSGMVGHWLVMGYPWAVTGYLVLVFGQFVVGYFFNDFLKAVMGLNVLIFMGLLIFGIISAFAHDARFLLELKPAEEPVIVAQ